MNMAEIVGWGLPHHHTTLRPPTIRLTYRRMIRILHLVEAAADFQTERGAMQLALGLSEGFQTEVKTIGPGGDWPNIITASRQLRQFAGFDLLHAWGSKALTVAVMGGRRPIVYSPA